MMQNLWSEPDKNGNRRLITSGKDLRGDWTRMRTDGEFRKVASGTWTITDSPDEPDVPVILSEPKVKVLDKNGNITLRTAGE